MQFTIDEITDQENGMVNMQVTMDNETRDHLVSYGLRKLLEEAANYKEQPFVFDDWDHTSEQPNLE